MAGTFIDVTDARVISALDVLRSRLDDPTPAYQRMADYLLHEHQMRWDAGIDPQGDPWAELKTNEDGSPSRYAQKKAAMRPNAGILVFDGLLMDLVAQFSSDGFLLGTSEVYGATHQFGDDSRGIVQREFLGYSASDLDEIIAIIEQFFVF